MDVGATLIAGPPDLDSVGAAMFIAPIAAARGDDATLERCLFLAEQRRGSTYVDQRASATGALAIEAAITLGDKAAIAELETFVAELPPARATPLLRAGRARLAAEQSHHRGDADAAARSEQQAIELLRSVGALPLLAKALLERSRRHEDPEALREARAIYEELGATRWLERLDQTSGVPA